MLGRFALDRRDHPDATAYVYAADEFHPMSYGEDASVAFAPRVHILSVNDAPRRWPVPLRRLILVGEWRRAPIAGAYLSPAARALASPR